MMQMLEMILKALNGLDHKITELQDRLSKVNQYEKELLARNQKRLDTINAEYSLALQRAEQNGIVLRTALENQFNQLKLTEGEIRKKSAEREQQERDSIIQQVQTSLYAIHSMIFWLEKEKKQFTPKENKKALQKPINPQYHKKQDLEAYRNIILDVSLRNSLSCVLHLNGRMSKPKMIAKYIRDCEEYIAYLKNEIRCAEQNRANQLTAVSRTCADALRRDLQALEQQRNNIRQQLQAVPGKVQQQKNEADAQKKRALAAANLALAQDQGTYRSMKSTLNADAVSLMKSQALKQVSDLMRDCRRNVGLTSAEWNGGQVNNARPAFALGEIICRSAAQSPSMIKALEQNLPGAFLNGSYRIPYVVGAWSALRLFIQYDASSKASVETFVQNIVLQKMRCTEHRNVRIFFADPQNLGAKMGPLTAPEKENATIKLYDVNTKDAIRDTLAQLVQDINTMTGVMGTCRSIYEYNRQPPEEFLCETLLVLSDASDFMGTEEWSRLKVIAQNAERCGVSIVFTTGKDIPALSDGNRNDCSFLNDVRFWKIRFSASGKTLQAGGNGYPFAEYRLPVGCAEFLKAYRKQAKAALRSDNDFTHYYDIDHPQPYHDSTDGLCLPIMVESKVGGKITDFVIRTNNASAHTMITGITGSGKTGVLKLIIASITARYHPDDVEIWLVDYGRDAFRSYLTKRPPHVRLLSLENSSSFTYSFLRYMKSYMDDRINRYGEFEKYRRQYGPLSMPRIVIMIDEFHNMTQHIKAASEDEYTRILENALREYRKYGVSFILCDQTSDCGLNQNSYDQLNNRIAMTQSSKRGVVETLNLQPPEDCIEFIQTSENSRGRMICRNECTGKDLLRKYVSLNYGNEGNLERLIDTSLARSDVIRHDTEVIAVGGDDTRRLWGNTVTREDIAQLRSSTQLQLILGTPTTLERLYSVTVQSRANNNILIGGANGVLATDIMISVINSLLPCQNVRIVVIGAEDDDELERLYHYTQRDAQYAPVSFLSDPEEICTFIAEQTEQLRQCVRRKEKLPQKNVIFWLGLPDLQSDFSTYPPSPSKKKKQKNETHFGFGFFDSNDSFVPDISKPEVVELLRQNGMTPADVVEAPTANNRNRSFFDNGDDDDDDLNGGCYNASDDVTFLYQQGCKYGLFHLVYLDQPYAIRRIGLKLTEFKHKIAMYMSVDERDTFEIGTRLRLDAELTGEDRKQTVLYCDGTHRGTMVYRPFRYL